MSIIERKRYGGTKLAKYYGFIGTYTQRLSKGIYSFIFNADVGEISEIQLALEVEKPSYLTISPNNHFIYSIIKEGKEGGIGAYKYDKMSKKLTLVNKQLSTGSPPCHVSMSLGQRHLLASNYHKGTVESFLIEDDGSLSPIADTVQHEGSGPDNRQEKAHTHYASLTPDEKYVVAIDLGSDKIYTYKMNERGQLTEIGQLSVKAGSGPRHITFHPSLSYAYVICELSSEILILDYNKETGLFTERQYVKTIPVSFTENNQGSAIQLTTDGRFLYAGNRGHDSIAIFQVSEGGHTIQLLNYVSTKGKWPRDFTLDPSEQFLIVGNQESDNIVIFKRDKMNGHLQLISDDVIVPEPVCIKFFHY